MAIPTIKRVVPQNTNEMSFKTTTALEPGQLVKLSAANTVAVATATDGEVIGSVLYDDAHARVNDDASYASGDVVPVRLFQAPINVSAAGSITLASFVKLAANGQVQVEATAGTKTLNTIGIALETAATDDEFLILPLL